MTTTLQNYQNAVRELERARNSGDKESIRIAEDNYDDARTKWDAERNALVDNAHIAQEDEKNAKTPPPNETEKQYVKRHIKLVRYALARAREENKILYRQLDDNRTTKRQLNKEYDILRARKNNMKKVSL